MENFIEVNKTLGESVTSTTKLACREMRMRPRDWNYQTVKKFFCDNLKSIGYNIISNDGCYIIASKDSETVTFYFSAHNTQNKNYCIPTVLKYRVDYFAFYDNKHNSVRMVGYGIVRNYCKNIKNAYVFYNNYRNQKMLIPDEWAQHQKINTMLLY